MIWSGFGMMDVAGKVDYATNTLLLAVAYGGFPKKDELLESALKHAEVLAELFPDEDVIQGIPRYIETRGWEAPGMPRMFEDGGSVVHASSVLDIMLPQGLLPLIP